MEDKYITYETAKLAKEKKYEQFAMNGINKHGSIVNAMYTRFNDYSDSPEYIACPSQSLLQRWLRSVHRIDVIPYPIESFKNDVPMEELTPEYTYHLLVKGIKTFITKDKIFESYEDALEIGLQEGLKLINVK